MKQVKLENLQRDLFVDPSAENIDREKNRYYRIEGSFQSRGNVSQTEGQKLETCDEIANEFMRYFSTSLGEVDLNVGSMSVVLLREMLGVELTAEMGIVLLCLLLSRKSRM
ncbi:hypothetical protein V6N13_000121 [Hibiscus sabdariffa]